VLHGDPHRVAYRAGAMPAPGGSRTRARPAEVAVPPQTSLRCCLTISGNVLESRDATGLVVLNTAPDSDGSLVLAGNQLRGRPWPGAVACLYLLRSSAAAANVIVHSAPEQEPDASLVVLVPRHHGRHQSAMAWAGFGQRR